MKARDAYPAHPDYPSAMPAERVLLCYWPRGVPFAMPTEFHPSRFTVAYVNHSRWVADCAWCPSATVVDPEDRRFFCVHCLNGGTGAWAHVEWPEDWEDIEAELCRRPNPLHRNCGPEETVAALRQERVEREDIARLAIQAFEQQGGRIPVIDVSRGVPQLVDVEQPRQLPAKSIGGM